VEIDSCLLVNNDTGIYAAQYTDGRIYKCVVDSSETNGIYCLYNSVEIETDTLRYGETGLSCYAGGNPVVSGGGWFKGNSAGIKCDYYSSPTIDVTKVTGSTNGVIAIDHSEPDLAGSGNDPCVGNSLHHNTVDVSNLDSTITIDATRVYWGSSTGPDPGSIYGSVDYLPYCTSDPLPSPPGPPPGGGDQPGDKVPVVYSLSYNYPNPFNPTTTLRYDVPRPGTKVEIVVYNIRGQRVRTLVSEMRAPGVYQTEWNGLDESGSPVASGVYFVRMKAGTFTNTKKLVLIK
jgi:hypothetical protein